MDRAKIYQTETRQMRRVRAQPPAAVKHGRKSCHRRDSRRIGVYLPGWLETDIVIATRYGSSAASLINLLFLIKSCWPLAGEIADSGVCYNVEFSGTPAALSPEAPLERRVGGAVPPAPTFDKGEKDGIL
jgi:hypothetical protein